MDLPSVLGGLAQGFKDFGTSVVDLFGTGGANVADIIESIRTGKATTRNQDDFRKWLYNTDSVKDAAAKGLGTALNGVQTVSDYIPGIGAVTRNPLFNAAQGALGGLADEFKTYGEDYDLGRAGQRAAVSGAAALAGSSLGDALKKSANPILQSGLAQGLARGAAGGAINQGGYAAIDGGDVWNSALQGAGMGALLGGATGLAQDFKPAKTHDVALTDDERAARIANAQKQIDDIGPVPMFTDDPDNIAKRARISELRDSIKAYQAGYDTTQDYKDAMAARRANRKPYTPPEAQYQPKIGEDVALGATEVPEGYTRLYRGLETEFDPKYVPQVSDNGYGYESWSDSYDLAREYAGPDGNIYSVDVPNARIADQIVTPDGERMPVVRTDKKAGLKSFSDENKFIDGKEYLLNVNDPLRQELTYSRVTPANTLENAPSENMKLYRGISAPDDATLQRYIDEMKDPNIAPTTYSGGSAYGQGYYFTPDEGLARYYANESGLPSTAIMEIEVPRNRFTEISKEKGNRPADFDLAAVKRGVPEDIRYETGLKDFNDYLDNNGYWGSRTSGENPTYTIMRNDAVLNAKRIDAPSLETTLSDADMAVNNPKLTPEQEAYFKDSVIRDENGNLKPMYHGSPDGTFTVFKDGSFFTDDKDYADVYQDNSAGMATGKKTINPKTYEVYLNVKKPFTMADPEARRIIKDEYIGRDKNYWVGPTDETEVDFTEADNLRNWLKKNHPEYDGLYVNEGGGDDPFADDGWEEWRGNSVVPFSPNQIKDINNLKPTSDVDIMASRMTPDEMDLARALARQDMAVNSAKIAPGQLGLFDDLPTQTPKTGTRQTSLFDQPQERLDYYGGDIEAPVIEPTNPYAPVDGKFTKAMEQRYDEIMEKARGFDNVVDNELYNKIDKSTLPKGYDKLRQYLDGRMSPDTDMVSKELVKGIGTDMPLQANTDKLLDYVYGDDHNAKVTFNRDLDEHIKLNRKNGPALGIDADQAEQDARKAAHQRLVSEAIDKARKTVIDEIVGESDSDDILFALQNSRNKGIRGGDVAALDTILSERLGIAPGNTVKIDRAGADEGIKKNTLGRYSRNARDIAINDMNSREGKVSTVAHERLHSFQNEAKPESAGRYSAEVAEAYKELQKDLGHYYKSNSEIKKRYKSDVDYWARSGEQESRMFQQYLENKGYTNDGPMRKLMGREGEWGNEINPAFDKFINKLRDLSKRGVALPALAGLLGGGVVLDQVLNSKDSDKDKKKTKRSA